MKKKHNEGLTALIVSIIAVVIAAAKLSLTIAEFLSSRIS